MSSSGIEHLFFNLYRHPDASSLSGTWTNILFAFLGSLRCSFLMDVTYGVRWPFFAAVGPRT